MSKARAEKSSRNERWSLQEKTALVTGGTRGIGSVKPWRFFCRLPSLYLIMV